MANTSKLYEIALSFLKGVGLGNAKMLISYCGSPEAIFNTSAGQLQQIPGIGKITAQKIIASKVAALRSAEKELLYLEKENDIETFFFTEEKYPVRLKFCIDAPVMFYFKGNIDLDQRRILAVVGTRNITDYGRKIVQNLMEELATQNVLVVSGLAYGVDAAVHKACVDYNIETVGVLGHGLDKIYPAQNRKLARKMLENGGLLSEYTHGSAPDREHFPMRNRIIAGLADATIIVESGESGGSLITGEIAASYNRDVFAFPGRIQDQFSRGCHTLIKRQKALLVENAQDIFFNIGWTLNEQSNIPKQRSLLVDLNDDERTLATLLQAENLSSEMLSVKSSLALSVVNTVLLNLELRGIIRTLPGNLYSLN